MNFNAVTDSEIVRFENLRTQNLLYGQDFLVCPLCTIKARFKGAKVNKILIIGKRKYCIGDALKCDCGGLFVLALSRKATLPCKKYKDELHGSAVATFEFQKPQKNGKSPKNRSGDTNNSLFS